MVDSAQLSVLAKAQLYQWIYVITGRTWLVHAGDAKGLHNLSPVSLAKGYAALEMTDHAPTCLTVSNSTLSMEAFQHVITSCSFTATTQHTGNAARPWEYSGSLKSMIALDSETAGYDLAGGSIGYGNYFDKECFCSAFIYDPNNEPCSRLDLAKERLWINATCGSMSLPRSWMDKLKIIGFAYVHIEDWYWSVNVADMPKQVVELTDRCVTDVCDVDSNGYCKVKHAVDRACFCSALTVDLEGDSRSGLELTKEWLWINATCGPTLLPNDWTNKLKTTGFAYILMEEWHWPRCVADMPKQVIDRTSHQCSTDACEVDVNGYCKVKRAVDRACFCRDIVYDSCGGSCHVFETRIDYVKWLHDLCGSVQDWHGLPDNWRQVAAPTPLEILPWRWTIKPTETCASNEWKIRSIALTNIATLFAAFLSHGRSTPRIIRGFLLRPRPGSWFSKAALIVALQLLANWFNTFLIQKTPGYEDTPAIQVMLLWCSIPRLTWLTVLLIGVRSFEALDFSATSPYLLAELIFQLLSSYYMGITIQYGRKHNFYFGGLENADRETPAQLMYVGALIWLIIVCLAPIGIILAATYSIEKNRRLEKAPLMRSQGGAYGTFPVGGQNNRVSHKTPMALFQILVIGMLLLWIAQWLFWGGFIGVSSEEFCPPKLGILTVRPLHTTVFKEGASSLLPHYTHLILIIQYQISLPSPSPAVRLYKCYKRRHTVRYTGLSRKALEDQRQRLVAEKEAKLESEVKKRKAQEDDTTKGKQIWFSRYVQNGRFKHWVLVIEDTKYELRRDDSSGNYTANIASWTIDKEKREAAIAEQKQPHINGYYVCLVGWTTKQPQELKQICEEVMSQFGKYNLVFNNCQNFLKTFADRVISEAALDWAWFRENTKTEYQETQALKIPTPDEIIAANRSAAQQQITANNQRQINHNIHMMSEAIHVQSQISLANQLSAMNQQFQIANQNNQQPQINQMMTC
ncbi:hypothetical protein GQX73_g9786 [Xylaria multiplex]|uniref:PPPDE domain-containing protein n=1 Tax=Xylaria multiplex TaxID=323545 RepID=A0A7C8IHG0_9PEZI|nr:hypothetical protein GQX73_g9786 [Xylaria multiplex]